MIWEMENSVCAVLFVKTRHSQAPMTAVIDRHWSIHMAIEGVLIVNLWLDVFARIKERLIACRLSRPYNRYSFWPELWCRWSNASRALWRSFSIVATIGQNNTKKYIAWANLLQLESRKSNQKIITIIIWIDFASLLIIENFSSNLLLRSRIIDSS